jgi:hypothetical protein
MGEPPAKSPLRFTRFADIDPAPRKVFLVSKFLGDAEISCMFGAPGSGKSILAADLACHVAGALPWLGRKVLPGAVLYVAAERAKLVERRLAAFRKYYAINDLPLAVISGAVDLRTSPKHASLIAGYVHDLAEETAQPVRLIVIDTVSRVLCGGDENSPKDMGALVSTLTSIQEASGAHICVLHHIPQDGNNRLRGHGALLGAVDTTVSIEKIGGSRIATVVKDNDGADGDRVAFDIKGVFLTKDPETGEETWAPVVLPIEDTLPKSNKAKKLTDQQKVALEALTEALSDIGKPAPVSGKIPANAIVVPVEEWKTIALTRGLSNSDKESAGRMAFKRAQEALVASHRVAVWDGLAWQL